jgi:hypothetical protein
MTDKTRSLRAALRRLWADHVIWTRQYVIAAVGDTPDAEAAATRLLENQEDIGGAVVPFYGAEAGAALTDLLKQHILIAVELVDAAKTSDDARFQREDAKWTANAGEIGALLSGANPNWSADDLADLLGLHLSLTKQEVVARLQQNWAEDIETFDQIFTEILTLADVLADGIVAQFPDKFAA